MKDTCKELSEHFDKYAWFYGIVIAAMMFLGTVSALMGCAQPRPVVPVPVALPTVTASIINAPPKPMTIGEISDFCLSVAELMKTVALNRDHGVPMEKTVGAIQGTFDRLDPVNTIYFVRMARAVYATALPPLTVSGEALDDCMAGMKARLKKE